MAGTTTDPAPLSDADAPAMTERERFAATMHYRPRDRAPICDFGFWRETIDAWHDQGLSQEIPAEGHGGAFSKAAGMDDYHGGVSPNIGLKPGFGHEVIEDLGDEQIARNNHGVIVRSHKTGSSIPMHLGHTLVDRASWEEHFKPRLDPDTPGRTPSQEQIDAMMRDDYPHVRTINGGSLYGWIRDWMGMENVSMLVYDDAGLFQEMIDTLVELTVMCHRRVLEMGARYDACSFWEDMCFNAGPLLSPSDFKRFMLPGYQRITGQLREYGCDVCWVDCDGRIDELLPLWLEGGVNCMFPIEGSTSGGDPVRFRTQYGKDLLMMGGFDKRILAQSTDDIDREIDRLTPVVEEGGYIPFADHRVPPDVPLNNYLHYLQRARAVWGHGRNLQPMDEALAALVG